MGDELTDQQIQRDNFLRQLAFRPRLALAHWHRLPMTEKVTVTTYMNGYYDKAFCQHFLAQANKRARPESVIHITNLREVTDARLRAGGFRFLRDIGGTKIWVHPNGQEFWVLSPPSSPPPPGLPPSPPDIEEIKVYNQDFTDQRMDLYRRSKELRQLKSQLDPDEYARRREQWVKDYEDMDDDMQDKLDNVIPSQTGQLTPEQQVQKQDQIDRLKDLKTTYPVDFFPPNPDD